MKAKERTELAEATCHYGESDSIPLGSLGDHVEVACWGRVFPKGASAPPLQVFPHERNEASISTLDKALSYQETPWSFEGCSWGSQELLATVF